MADPLSAPNVDRRRPIAVVGALNLSYEGLPADLRETRTADAADVTRRLQDRLGRPLVDLGLVTDLDGAATADQAITALDPAAIVVLALGAIRADVGAAIVASSTAPVLVWAVTDDAPFPDDHRPIDSVVGAGPVGAYAMTNALVRLGRSVRCEVGAEPAPGTIAWVRAAAFAADVARARFGLVGGRWPGMLDVHLDATRFTSDFGATWEDVSLSASTPETSFDELGVPVGWSRPDIDPGLIAASCRLGRALRTAAVGFDALAVRCHSDAVGSNPAFGVVGCLGVSLLSSSGIPTTCTGDMVTAVAMYVASSVAGAAQYVEVDGPDVSRAALLVSNGGEIDQRSARADSIGLVEQQFFSGDAGRGLALRGLLETGPATIVAFTETRSGWRLVTMEGEILDDHLPGFPVTHAFFRSALDPAEAFRRLGDAGAPHHVAIAPGHIGDVAAALATMIPLEHVAIGDEDRR